MHELAREPARECAQRNVPLRRARVGFASLFLSIYSIYLFPPPETFYSWSRAERQ